MNKDAQGTLTPWLTLALTAALLVQISATAHHIVPFVETLSTMTLTVGIAFHVMACLMAAFSLVGIFLSLKKTGIILGVLALGILLATLSFSLLPILARDALIHHLAVPKLWNEAGQIVELHWHSWSYYPGLLHQVYAYGLRLDAEAFTVAFHWSYVILIAALIGHWLATFRASTMTVTLGVCLAVALPLHIRLATEPMVDLALAFYFTAGLALLIQGNRPAGSPHFGTTLLAGLAVGLALSSKYNALLALACAAPFLWLSLIKVKGLFSGTAALALCLGFAVLVFSPWGMRNFLWTGNPVYPLYQSVFQQKASGSEVIESDGEKTGTLGALAQRHLLYDEDIQDYLLTPVRMILFGRDHDPRFYDGVLIPLMLLFPLGMRNRKLLFLGLAILVYWYAASLFASGRIRYLAPVIPTALFLTALGIDFIAKFFKAQSRYFLLLASGLALIFGYFYLGQVATERKLIPYLQGSIAREAYLEEYIEEWKLLQRADELSSRDERILLLFTPNRYYYFSNPAISSGHYSGDYLLDLLRESRSAEELYQFLTLRGVRIVLLHQERLLGYLNLRFQEEPKLQATWNEFVQLYLNELGTQAGYLLVELKPKEVGAETTRQFDEAGEHS